MASGFRISYDLFGKVVTTDVDLLRCFSSSAFTSKDHGVIARAIVNVSSVGTTSLLLYQLLKLEFERCARSGEPVILQSPSLTLHALSYFLRHTCIDFVKTCLEPSLRPILDGEDQQLRLIEFDPTKYPDDLPIDELEEQIGIAADKMTAYVHACAGVIFSRKTSRDLPVTVQSLARFVKELSEAYDLDPTPQLGALLFGRLFCRCIATPERWGIDLIDTEEVSSVKRRVLKMLSLSLSHLGLGTRFDESDASLEPLNMNIDELQDFSRLFLNKCCIRPQDLASLHQSHGILLDENIRVGLVTSTPSLALSCVRLHRLLFENRETYLSDLDVASRRKVLSVLFSLPTLSPETSEPEPDVEEEEDDVNAVDAEQNEIDPTRSDSPITTGEEPIVAVSTRYQTMLAEASYMKFNDFEYQKVITFPGTDSHGLPIVLFREPLMFDQEQTDRLLYYIFYALDEFTRKGPYSVVVLLNREEDNRKAKRPGMKWFVNAYKVLPRHFKKNMKHFFLVHPNLLVSILMKVLGPLFSRKVFRKVHMCSNARQIYSSGLIAPLQCPLPQTSIGYNISKFEAKAGPSNPIFGIPLRDLLSQPQNRGELLPLFHRRLLEYMEERKTTEGIFRRAGNTLVINGVKDAFDYGYEMDLTMSDFHSVCGAFKLWFRDLPEPILPMSMYREFLSNAPPRPELKAAAGKKCARLFRDLKASHPEEYYIAVALFRFLHRVSLESEVNLMVPTNLAICFGPNLLRSPAENPMAALQDNSRIVGVTEVIIQFADKIFSKDIDELKASGEKTMPRLDVPEIEIEGEGEVASVDEEPLEPAIASDMSDAVMRRRRGVRGALNQRRERASRRSSNFGAHELTMLQFALAEMGGDDD